MAPCRARQLLPRVPGHCRSGSPITGVVPRASVGMFVATGDGRVSDMPQVALGRPATYEDLVAVADNLVAEIVDGELWTSPRPAPRHAVAYSALAGLLGPPFHHGRGGPGGWWIIAEPELHLGNDVLVPDLAGFGRTPLHGRRANVQANARLLAAFVDRVAGGPAVVLGNSMGGLIGLMVAASSPRLVRALVLVDAVHAPAWGSRLDPEVALIFSIYMVPGLANRVLAAHARRATPEQVVRQMMRLCYADPSEFQGDLLDTHVALETERRSMPWARPSTPRHRFPAPMTRATSRTSTA